jgi:hypothetical protein
MYKDIGAGMRFISILSVCICLLSITGCKKDQATTPVATGGVHGFVWLNTEDHQWPSDRSGITVSVEGTQIFCQTDTSGKYLLNGIELGQRILVYTKSGYGLMKREINIEQSVNYSTLDVNLSQLPTFRIQKLTVLLDSVNHAFGLVGTLSKVFPNWQGMVIYCYTDSTVSSDTSKYIQAWATMTQNDSSTVTIGFDSRVLMAEGFPIHQKLYFVAYGTSYVHPYYWDSRIKKDIYTTLSVQPSNVVSVTLSSILF